MIENPNSKLDPQSEVYSFALMTPGELAEYDEWLAHVANANANYEDNLNVDIS